MQISFIIVTWNCLRQIQHCLSSLQDLKIPDSEIIVIDAASTDGTWQWLRTVEGIRFYPMREKQSWSMNNRLGIRLARGDWLCIMNPDIYFNESFRDCLKYAYANPDAIVGPQLVNLDGKLQYPCKHLNLAQIVMRWTILGSMIQRRLLQGYVRRTYLYFGEGQTLKVEHLTASIFIVSRQVIEFAGGSLWDPSFTWVCADSDIFRRAELLKLPVIHYGETWLIHEGGYTKKKSGSYTGDLENSYGLVNYMRIWGHASILKLLVFLDAILLPLWLLAHGQFSMRNNIRRATYRVIGIFQKGPFQLA